MRKMERKIEDGRTLSKPRPITAKRRSERTNCAIIVYRKKVENKRN